MNQPTTTAPHSKKKTILIATTASIALLTAAATYWLTTANRPPRPTDNPISITKFAATPEFAKLTDDQKAPYLIQIRNNLDTILAAAENGQLTRDEQKQAVRNVIRGRAHLELKEYVALPPGPARKAKLDRLIDEQEKLRQRANQAAQRGEKVGPDPIALKQFAETLPPQERIQMAQFAFDLMQRRRERGLPAFPFPEAGQ